MSRTEVNYQSGVGTFALSWAPRAVALTPRLERPDAPRVYAGAVQRQPCETRAPGYASARPG